MSRFTEVTTREGSTSFFSIAGQPTNISPSATNQTADGVSLLPSPSDTKIGNPLSMTPTSEWVVPKSIPAIIPEKRDASFS